MPVNYGVTNSGLKIKTLDVIRDEYRRNLQDNLQKNLNFEPGTVLSQILDIPGVNEAQIWALIQAVINNLNPETAQGINLDYVAAFNGLTRNQATRSVIEKLVIFGLDGSVIPQGTQIQAFGETEQSGIFQTTEDLTLTAVTKEEWLIEIKEGTDPISCQTAQFTPDGICERGHPIQVVKTLRYI